MAAEEKPEPGGGAAEDGGGGDGRILSPSFYIFALIAAVSGVMVWNLKGEAVFNRVLAEEGELLLVVFPRVVAGLLMAGFVQVLVPKELMARWVGHESGLKGIVIASAAGILTPGGPLTAFPLLYTLYISGASRGALVAFITGWALLGMQRILVWELPFLGVDFVLMRFAVCIALPVLAGMVALKLPIRLTVPGHVPQPVTVQPPRDGG